MRIARWRSGDVASSGFVIGDRVVSFPERLDVRDVLANGLDFALRLAEDLPGTAYDSAEPVGEVVLLAPVEPPSVRDFVSFEEHVEGVSASIDGVSHVPPEWFELPTFYFTNPHTIIATGDVLLPPVTAQLDFELEVAAVIGGVAGSTGSNLTPEQGAAHIFGYTIMNDWSARDLQRREMQVRLGPCKGKDFATTLGPWIVTADEFRATTDEGGFLPLQLSVEVNGTVIGRDLLSNMGWPFGELVAYASRNSIVRPGDVLGSGTAGNGGCLAELWGRRGRLKPAPLGDGDEVRLTVELLGEISNTVGPPVAAPEIPHARTRPRARARTTA